MSKVDSWTDWFAYLNQHPFWMLNPNNIECSYNSMVPRESTARIEILSGRYKLTEDLDKMINTNGQFVKYS